MSGKRSSLDTTPLLTEEPTFFQRYKPFILAGAIIGVVLFVGVIIAILVGVIVGANNDDEDDSISDMMDVANVVAHLQQLQDIANLNNGTRSAESTGYMASVEYIVQTLNNSGYAGRVIVQNFPISITRTATSTLGQTAPIPITYVQNTDFLLLDGSGSGNLTNTRLQSILNYGCGDADYVGFTAGNIALVIRGPLTGNCTFNTKAIFAQKYGAGGLIIFNDGLAPDRMGLMSGTLSGVFNFPALFATFVLGELLNETALTQTVTMNLSTSVTRLNITSANVIADSEYGDNSSVLQIGAHLDSVNAGPGINDDGSGSAMILELAIQVAQASFDQQSKIRFSWWGGEERGLLGSTYFVNTLVNSTNSAFGSFDDLAAYLNFDMIGSPNFMRGILNGSSAEGEGQVGSERIQREFENYFSSDSVNLTWIASGFGPPYRSDYGPFVSAGVASGGLFTGAEGVKSDNERNLFGGLANAAYDPCYHQACDNINNINEEVLDQNSKAAATILQTMAEQQDLRGWLISNSASAAERYFDQ